MNLKEILLRRRFELSSVAFFVSVCLNILSPLKASGQQPVTDVDPEISEARENVAPVKIDGNTLFYVHGITSYPAEMRADAIGRRIKKAAKNITPASDSVRIIEGEGKSVVYAGQEFIMNIYESDAAYENIDRNSLAQVIHTRIETAIQQYRNERSRPVLIGKSIHALGAAVLLTGILFAALWLIRIFDKKLQTKIRSGIDSVEVRSFRLIKSGNILKIISLLFKTIKVLTIIIIIGIFIEYILGIFPWTNNVAVSVLELFLKPLKTIGKGILNFIPGLAFLIVIFFITRYFLKLIKLLFTGIDQGAIDLKDFHPSWAMPTFRILRVFIIAFALVIAYPYIPGSQSNAFKGVTVFLGVLFSLGSSSFIGNIIAGYSMTYRLAFKKGDLIQVDDQIGFVEEQKILVTRLRSHKNEEIVIPNSILQNSKIINFSAREKDQRLILHTIVGIGYETPWRQVDAMLKLAADRTEGLLKDPPPFVLKDSLGDFAVNYEINVFCGDVNNIKSHYSKLHQNILDVFNENNVQIMTPAYEYDPEIPKVVPRDQWDLPLVNDEVKV
jgi:small-conductance mechanosensitive channel